DRWRAGRALCRIPGEAAGRSGHAAGGRAMSEVQIAVPDLGDFDEVSVIEVLVKAGDVIEVDTPLVTLETENATMDVPSTAAGTLAAVLVKAGDKVGKGTVIAHLTAAATQPGGAEGATGAGDSGGKAAGSGSGSAATVAAGASAAKSPGAAPGASGATTSAS